MRLVAVNPLNAVHVGALYQLLQERDPATFVSHAKMPTRRKHLNFVRSQPFRFWYLIDARVADHDSISTDLDWMRIGAIEVTDRNELGITIFKRWQREGYGGQALELFLLKHRPLPAIPAIRNGSWLANIAPGNEASRKFFASMGFTKIQETWRL